MVFGRTRDRIVSATAIPVLILRSEDHASPKISENNAPDDLTRRRLEILALAADGKSNAEIAEKLFVSRHTVGNHLRHIFAKTGTRNRTEAVAVTAASRYGWLG